MSTYWNREAKVLFLKALERPSGNERRVWLGQACAGNTELRQAVERLLRAHDDAGSAEDSVTTLLNALKDGDETAAKKIWERYHLQLVSVARTRLQSAYRGAVDEEDVAQNAFKSFFRAMSRGRFGQLCDRNGLSRLLVAITVRKVFDQLKHEHKHTAELNEPDEPGSKETMLRQVPGREPSPAFAALAEDQFQRLLAQLGDESLCRVAIWRMEGYGNDEIARMLGCSLRTVARKLETIRIIWKGKAAR